MNVRVSKPAPTSNAVANMSCATTRPLRSLDSPRPEPPLRTPIACRWLVRDNCSAGRTPNTTLVIAAMASAIHRMPRLSPNSCCRGSSEAPNVKRKMPGDSTVANDFTIDTPRAPTMAPTAPPANASTRHSVNTCRTTRPRVAPIANRTATSRRRVVPRASRRFATFAQTMSSTTTTAASSTRSAGCIVRTA